MNVPRRNQEHFPIAYTWKSCHRLHKFLVMHNALHSGWRCVKVTSRILRNQLPRSMARCVMQLYLLLSPRRVGVGQGGGRDPYILQHTYYCDKFSMLSVLLQRGLTKKFNRQETNTEATASLTPLWDATLHYFWGGFYHGPLVMLQNIIIVTYFHKQTVYK